MIPTELWLIYALVFGAVLLGFQGIYWVLFKERREKQAINRRLALTAELANPKEVLEILRKERGVDLAPIPALQSFKELVVQSGVRWTGVKLLLVAAVPTMLFFLLLRFATGSSFLAIALAGLLAAASIYSVPAIRPPTPDRRIQRAIPRCVGRDLARLAGRASFQSRHRSGRP